ncbi:hypothetical protein [Actinomadura sp. WAC 06369]|uniref:hypothetical protein n=1 Tax=Actinomadura sp. WAC 06369 TaxID=2203193 RepID=UPI000F7B7B9A|nr:hypothetical protein [Actinomadura sp. WAC 06369]RSN46507.1 hypothetical protein DMH08_35830 [Actinomadura sp. WAC 06369]
MWADLQVALIGVIGTAALAAAVHHVRGRRLRDGLVLGAGGLWFLFCFTSIVFLDLPFTPAPVEQFVLIALVYLVRHLWRLHKRRRDRQVRTSRP